MPNPAYHQLPEYAAATTDCSFQTKVSAYFAADADRRDELLRLRRQEFECDPRTFRHFEAINVGRGWHCLEVGAGAGSVVGWLSQRVGAAGQVVAVDIDPSLVADRQQPNVEVRKSDIVRDEVELDHYDLVHCRGLLIHLADPVRALQRFTAALRPGGWLLVEEPDLGVTESVDPGHPLAEKFDFCSRKLIEFFSRSGTRDCRFGRNLPAHMHALALEGRGNEAVTRVINGGDPYSLAWIQTWQRLADEVVHDGLLTASDVADVQRAYADPAFLYRAELMHSAWGRKPLTRLG